MSNELMKEPELTPYEQIAGDVILELLNRDGFALWWESTKKHVQRMNRCDIALMIEQGIVKWLSAKVADEMPMSDAKERAVELNRVHDMWEIASIPILSSVKAITDLEAKFQDAIEEAVERGRVEMREKCAVYIEQNYYSILTLCHEIRALPTESEEQTANQSKP